MIRNNPMARFSAESASELAGAPVPSARLDAMSAAGIKQYALVLGTLARTRHVYTFFIPISGVLF